MPLTDAGDATWAVAKLQVYLAALRTLIKAHQKMNLFVDTEGADLDPFNEAVLAGEAQTARDSARDAVLQQTLVAMRIMREVLNPEEIPYRVPDGPWIDVTEDLQLFADLAQRAIGLISDLGELDRRLGNPGPRMSAAAFHPVVWSASERLWRDGHHAQAVQAAAAAVNTYVQSLVSRTDAADATLMREVFSADAPALGKPRLRWPGLASDRTVKSMNDGLRLFAPGVFMTIRNPAAHGAVSLTDQEALEQLACLSALMRWVDACKLLGADQQE